MSTYEKIDVSKRQTINYGSVIWFIHLHLFAVYGLWMIVFEAKWMTLLFVTFLILISYIGVTIGAHRYFTHRAFEVDKFLKYFFILAHTLAGVGPLYDWVAYHRMHHKFYKINKDPYQTHKGFLYSYFWNYFLNSSFNKEELQKHIDMRDMEEPIIFMQKTFYWILMAVITLFIPIYIPIEYWNETALNSIFIMGFLRLAIMSNVSKMVNSAILVWGLKPEDRFPIEDNSMFLLNKTYWLNYHYLLPWDWKSTEFGKYNKGFSIIVIKILHEMGFLYLARTISSKAIGDALLKLVNKERSWEETITNLQEKSEENAIQKNLRVYH